MPVLGCQERTIVFFRDYVSSKNVLVECNIVQFSVVFCVVCNVLYVIYD